MTNILLINYLIKLKKIANNFNNYKYLNKNKIPKIQLLTKNNKKQILSKINKFMFHYIIYNSKF